MKTKTLKKTNTRKTNKKAHSDFVVKNLQNANFSSKAEDRLTL